MRAVRVSLVLGLILVAAVTRAASGPMSVQVKEGQLRSTPSFLAPVTGTVAYGDPVEVLQQQGDWANVANRQNQRGWIHQSALTTKRIALQAGGTAAATAASGQEVALAGKGFNAQVESQYRQTNRGADYTWVNRMEETVIGPEEMARFIEEGGMHPTEGGAR